MNFYFFAFNCYSFTLTRWDDSESDGKKTVKHTNWLSDFFYSTYGNESNLLPLTNEFDFEFSVETKKREKNSLFVWLKRHFHFKTFQPDWIDTFLNGTIYWLGKPALQTISKFRNSVIFT